jgi:branched-chain amino acid transport system ATP-binding protein
VSEQQDRQPLLEVVGLECSYGPLQVLFGVSVEVPEGDRVALLGTNGAGKSTLLRAIAGLLEPDAGTIRFAGHDLAGLSPAARVELGMTLVEGGRATFPSLTVAENLRMGAYPFLADRPRVDERMAAVLDVFPQLRGRLDDPAGVCSGGEQQMMAIGRALVAKPRLLIIDELSLGLAPIVMAEILAAIEQVVDAGTAVLLVEQSLNIALSLASRAYFMEKGEVRFAGATSDLLDRGDLVRSVFFGADAAAAEEVVSR